MKRFLAISVGWLALSIILCSVTFGQITPIADSYTDSATATKNYGTATLLYVDGATDVTYIQFNLASIPSTASVSQATLKLYVNSVTKAGSFNVDYVNSAWAESTIDASNAPTPGTTIASNVAVTTADKNQYILVDVTAAVQAWLSGSETNNGLALVANSSFSATFDSKENATTSHPAELDIAYAGGDGTITGVETASGSGLTGGGTTGTLNLSLTTACAANQVLQWNGSAWACSSAGTGTITGVTAGTDLTGGGTSGNVTLNLNTSALSSTYAQLAAANTFTGNQTVNGNLTATQMVSGAGFQIGSNLFDYGTYSLGNAFTGFAGNTTMTGNGNTANGYAALSANTSGLDNTASGLYALRSNTEGQQNTAVGGGAMSSNTTGNQNTAVGDGAMVLNTTGNANTALGAGAMELNTTGNYNTGTGWLALNSNSTGAGNTATGYFALESNMTGSNNTATGIQSLVGTTTGGGNVADGYNALYWNTTGSYNTALGYQAGNNSGQPTTGSNDTFLGANAYVGTQTNLNYATAIGANSEVNQNNALVLGSISGVNGCTSPCASTNVGIGTIAPAYTLDVEGPSGSTPTINFGSAGNPAALTVQGTGNFSGLVTFAPGQTFPGTGTITSVNPGAGLSGGGSSGSVTLNNTGVLSVTAGTGISSTGGQSPTLSINTSVVPSLTASNTFTSNQTVNGNLSATGVVTGSGFQIGSNLFDYGSYSNNNAFLGFAGNSAATGNWNTGSGAQALNSLTSGVENTAAGFYALTNNNTGGWNSAVGVNALWNNTTGTENAALGYSSGTDLDATAVTGSSDTFLGVSTRISTGTLTNATAVGANAEVAESNALVLGSINGVNFATADTLVGVGITNPTYKLHVGIINNGFRVEGPAKGTTNPVLASFGGSGDFAVDAVGTIGGRFVVKDTSGYVGINTPTPDANLSVNGSADKPGGGSWGTFSDRRLKDLDGSFSAGLKEIMKINPVKYRYKQENGMGIRDHDEHIGVVAQEIKEAIPEAVTESSSGYLLVNNDPVIWAMLNAIKEQQREIVALRKQLTLLQAKSTSNDHQQGRLTKVTLRKGSSAR